MSEISQILFLVSDSLLIPDIIVLLVLFVRALLLVGSFYNRFITKYKNDRLLNEAIRTLTPDTVAQLKDLLPERDNALYIQYLRDFVHHTPDEAYYNYRLIYRRYIKDGEQYASSFCYHSSRVGNQLSRTCNPTV